MIVWQGLNEHLTGSLFCEITRVDALDLVRGYGRGSDVIVDHQLRQDLLTYQDDLAVYARNIALMRELEAILLTFVFS